MSQFSPNLKPKNLHNHVDKARTLGVPKSNVLDLRKSSTSTPDDHAKKTVAKKKSSQLQEPKELGWWERRRVHKQTVVTETKPAATAKEVPVKKHEISVLQAKPIPEQAKMHSPVAKKLQRHRSVEVVRPLLTFVIVCTILVLPFGAIAMYQRMQTVRGNIVGLVQDAMFQLKQGKQSATDMDFATADQAFMQANTDFRSAQQQLDSTGTVITTLANNLPGTKAQFQNVSALLLAGEHITTASQSITQALKILSNLKDSESSDTNSHQSLTDVLIAVHSSLRPALPELQEATAALKTVQVDALPEEYRAQVEQAQTILPTVQSSADQLMSLSDTLITLLGAKEDKRYLVLFMNNRELRACSGFIGSFAQVDISEGKVTKMNIPGGGTYDVLGSFTRDIISPQPLHRVNAAWQMQDANWWPDCPTSFQKVEWFYSNSGGSSVDGVIGLTPDVVEKMLAITGPIDMTDPYGIVIDQDNFYQVTQILAEQKYDETRTSKQIIADLTPKLLDKFFSLQVNDYVPVIQLLYEQLNEKNIILYFNDPFIEQDIQQRGWAGNVKTAPQDYLQVVDTNIAGGKTNNAVEQTIHHHAAIQEDGSIIDTVTVTRHHYGKSEDVFEGINNLSYLRFYVPEGSTLLQAEGFSRPDPKLELTPTADAELDADLQAISGTVWTDEATGMRTNTEFQKTVFGNWIEVKPGESATVTVQYKLPFTLDISKLFSQSVRYSLLVQKQPGSFSPIVIADVNYPTAYTAQWAYPTAVQTAQIGRQRLLNTQLNTDIAAGLVLAK